MLKKYLLSVLLIAGCLFTPSGFASLKGDKAMGIVAGFNSKNRSALAGIYFSYGFSEHFRVVPNIRYVFQNRNQEVISMSLDTHYPFRVNSAGNFQVYPLAGLTYASNNTKSPDDVSTRYYRFGLNFGGGANLNLSPTLRLNLEGRYSLIKNFPTMNVSVGIGYCF